MNQLQMQPMMNRPLPSAMPQYGAEEQPKSGMFKWIMIILAILIIVGGLAYWIFAP